MAHFHKDNDDIQTDAQYENEDELMWSTSQTSFLGLSDLRHSHNSSSSKLDASPSPSLKYAQSARPIIPSDDREYLHYIKHMDDDLQEDNIDILIINSENDRKDALIFRNHLMKDIKFYLDSQERIPRVPRITLLQDIRHGSMDNLDLAFSKALYVFLYVTKEFCAEPWTMLQSQACLKEAIHDKDKRWCVVPVHTTSKKNQCYKLPMMLSSLRPINYWSGSQDQFYVEGVRKLLEAKTSLILTRERELDDARRNFFIEHRSEILKNAQYVNISELSTNSVPSPMKCSGNVQESSSKVSVSDSSNIVTAVRHANVCTYSSLPDQHNNKALPEESISVVIDRMEGIVVSEEQTLPENNSLHVNIRNAATSNNERASQEAPQQSESQNIHTNHSGVEHSYHNAANNNNDNCAQNVSIPVKREPFSSIVVDGPTSLSLEEQSPVHRDYLQRVTANPPASSSAHISSTAPAYTAQNMQSGMPSSFSSSAIRMQSPTVYGFPGQGYLPVDNYGTPVFMPGINYHGMQYQHFNPSYFCAPNVHQSLPFQQYPAMYPHNMQGLYTYANPIHSSYFCHNTMRSQSRTSEPGSDIENQQISTEANASGSLRSSLSDSSLTRTFNAFGSLQDMSNQCPQQPFQAWNSSPLQSHPMPHMTNHIQEPVPITRQQGQTVRNALSQQMSPQIPSSNERQILLENQQATGRTVTESNTQISQNSAGISSEGPGGAAISTGISSEGPGGAANPVIQHIHHHHHEKNITVKKATNVLIGDRSTFMNKDMAAKDEEYASSDTCNEEYSSEGEQSNISNSTRSIGSISKTSSSNTVASANPRNITSDAPENVLAGNKQNPESPTGFAECLSPVNLKQPIESSEEASFSEVDHKNRTDCKQFY